MNCLILFSGKKIRKNVINLSSAEFAQGVLKAKLFQVGKVGKSKNDQFFNGIYMYIITHQFSAVSSDSQ